ncbi:alpha/beta-type small acid-soluble spore protein [Bacillus sp. T33-2]|uniref:alpha/beta-type small acid-soluble spore protein n=1 Tax=Bacillus sp. T33-2 TaxID=2054168 RepID=UPI000C780F4A|nr:alpha/beta-type small acid-soluble spore protein [Bacillus sp. T33-2]PLR95389.1 alpha/beta hydrolase [Bacillus sp. T33-2]
MSRRNNILIPEARQGLDQLKAKVANTENPADAKFETAKEVGVPLKQGYNGNIRAHDAGRVGGNLGGSMVRELIKMAQQDLAKKVNSLDYPVVVLNKLDKSYQMKYNNEDSPK